MAESCDIDESALRKALARIEVGQLTILYKLIGRILEHPQEEKYRTLSTKSKTVEELLEIPGLEDFLRSIGFETCPSTNTLYAPKLPDGLHKRLLREHQRIGYELQAKQSAPTPSVPMPAQTPAEEVDRPVSPSALVIFDFDGTIAIDGQGDSGFSGTRLERLLKMAKHLESTGTLAVILTAQRLVTTEVYTVPKLRASGLAYLFCSSNVASDAPAEHMFYFQNPAHGGIYTGTEAFSKLPLIERIIAGENRWNVRFVPENVLFIDDTKEHIMGHERYGINAHHVLQDGMNDDDIAIVESFATAHAAASAAVEVDS